jgi:hypothetical protein
MAKHQQRWFLLGIVAAIATSSCSQIFLNDRGQSRESPAETKITHSQVSSNVDLLLKQLAGRIELPYRPDTVLWQTTQYGDGVLGPSDWTIRGVMTFKSIDADKMVTAAKKQGAPREDFIEVEDWFPDRLKTQAVKNPQNGQYQLKVKVYQQPGSQAQLMQVDRTSYWIVHFFTT